MNRILVFLSVFAICAEVCLLRLVAQNGAEPGDTPPIFPAIRANLTITDPREGTRLEVPALILIHLTAVDPDGDIRHVEFFANGLAIGKSDHWTKDAVIPGRPREHTLEWKVGEASEVKIWAVATTTRGEIIQSGSVHFYLESNPGGNPDDPKLSIVSIQASRFGTREQCAPNTPCTKELVFPAEFTIRRTPPLNRPLTVFLSYGGSATPKVDYPELPNEVRIPVGADSTTLEVFGLGDFEREQDESVGARLEPSGSYRIHPEQAEAKVVIQDRIPIFTEGIRIVTPGDNARFNSDEPILIRALAIDLGGAFTHLEVFDGDTQIGESNIQFFQKPEPGSPVEHEFIWKGASLGEHVLNVRGTDAKGMLVLSGKVPIVVTRQNSELIQVSLLVGDSDTSEPSMFNRIRPASVNLHRSGDAKEALKVFVVFDGSAINGKDFAELSPWVEFPQGVISVQVQIAALEDNIVEGDEVVSVELVEPPFDSLATYRINPVDNRAKVVIHDSTVESRIPIVGIESVVFETKENGCCPVCDCVQISKPAIFRVSRSGGSIERPLRVFAKLSGTVSADDFSSGFNAGKDLNQAVSVEIPAGDSSMDVQVFGLWDNEDEPAEVLVAELLPTPLSSDGALYYVDAKNASAKIVIYDRLGNGNSNDKSFVEILSPKSGERFVTPEFIQFTARTLDPKGAITHLDWFSESEKIGESEILFFRQPDPGSLITHEFTWKNPPAGLHKVYAQGTDSLGLQHYSPAVLIEVARDDGGPISEQVIVDIVESDPVGEELGADGNPKAAVLKLRRIAGPRDISVNVNLQMSGTAANGIDYAKLSDQIELPAGQDSVPVIITPIPDKAIEGDEVVIVTLNQPVCPAIYPPPANCYLLGQSSSARAVIRDSAVSGNRPPKVSIMKPSIGSVFKPEEIMEIAVEAADSDGEIVHVEISVDDKVVASGKTSPLLTPVQGLSVGRHTLTARAIDGQGGEAISLPMAIFVLGAGEGGSSVAPNLDRAKVGGLRVGYAPSDSHGKMRLEILGPVNQLIAVDVSDDLKNWTQLQPILLQGDGVGSREDSTTDIRKIRFYRARLLSP